MDEADVCHSMLTIILPTVFPLRFDAADAELQLHRDQAELGSQIVMLARSPALAISAPLKVPDWVQILAKLGEVFRPLRDWATSEMSGRDVGTPRARANLRAVRALLAARCGCRLMARVLLHGSGDRLWGAIAGVHEPSDSALANNALVGTAWCAAVEGKVLSAEWIIRQGATPSVCLPTEALELVKRACCVGSGDAARWATERFSVNLRGADRRDKRIMFGDLAERGSVASLEWLRDKAWIFTPADAVSASPPPPAPQLRAAGAWRPLPCPYNGLARACMRRRLDVADWILTSALGFPAGRELPPYYPARSGGRQCDDTVAADAVADAMCTCAANGHLDVLQWLANRLALSRDSVGHRNAARVLGNACSVGLLGEAVWIARRFELEAKHVRCWGYAPFRLACLSGHLDVAGWFAQKYFFGAAAPDATGDTPAPPAGKRRRCSAVTAPSTGPSARIGVTKRAAIRDTLRLCEANHMDASAAWIRQRMSMYI